MCPISSQPQLAHFRLVETEVVTDLVTHRLDHVRPQARRIVPEVAHERVAEDQDLVRYASAPEEVAAAPPIADVKAVGVVLLAAVGDDDRDVFQSALEAARETVERRAHDRLEFLLAVMPVSAHILIV